MARKADARYDFGLDYLRMIALNDDLTFPTPTNIIGGAGPFNFSGETIGAVPCTIKVDNGAATSLSVNLTAASDSSAVTVDEVVTALNTALTGASISETASKASTTNRLKLAGAGTEVAIQFYGDLAEICRIGQGFGVKWLTSDTIKSVGDTQVRKEGERIATTDSWGHDTEMVTDGYLKSRTLAVVDTATDLEMYALCEGLDYDGETLEDPTSETVKPFLGVELFYGKYREGENRREVPVGYRQKRYAMCKGRGGDKTHEYGFSDANYTIEAMSYRDSANALHGPSASEELTIAEFTALLVDVL